MNILETCKRTLDLVWAKSDINPEKFIKVTLRMELETELESVCSRAELSIRENSEMTFLMVRECFTPARMK